jgi:hypothetical protein
MTKSEVNVTLPFLFRNEALFPLEMLFRVEKFVLKIARNFFLFSMPPLPAFDVRPACKGRINNFQLHKNFRQYVAELEYTVVRH